METYLSLTDFTSRIPGIPTGFNILTMAPYFQQLREGWLNTLLPADNAFWTLPTPRTGNAPLHGAFARFAVYAIWSSYVLESTVITTETGQVVKQRDNSENIPTAQRAELHRKYSDLANAAASALSRAVLVVDPLCEYPARSLSGPSISTIKGRTTRNPFH